MNNTKMESMSVTSLYFVILIDWWMIDWLSDWLTGWLIVPLWLNQVINKVNTKVESMSVASLYCVILIDWLSDWLVDWLIDRLNKPRPNYMLNSFRYFGFKVWIIIQSHIKHSTSIVSFKRHYKKYLLEKVPYLQYLDYLPLLC